jgi:hypothetical protein
VDPQTPSTHDPELDPPRSVVAPRTPGPFLQEFQRLVTNPFLCLLGLTITFALARETVRHDSLPLALFALFALVGSFYLLQYHCLDCGATGPLVYWRSHACPPVLARQHAGRVRRYRGPNPAQQMLLWLYFLAAAAILAAVWASTLGE